MDRHQLLAAERSRLRTSPYGAIRVAVGTPAGYHAGMSSLAFQWVVELASRVPDVGLERFFPGTGRAGTTFETGTALGQLDVLAWSCSYEPDAVEVLRTLDEAGIPRRRLQRDHPHPLLVVGGPLATLNPLPLAPVIDVFCLGAAELLWPPLLELVRSTPDRGQLLEELARREGYFVPGLHTGSDGRPLQRLRRREKREPEMVQPEMIPASHVVTPHTEYADRVLVELSRGCPERCRYCWAGHASGRLRGYPAEGIRARVREAGALSRQIGFLATAAGDHPDLPALLEECRRLGLGASLSSLRIPFLTPQILEPLVASGARSVTIAPETGSDRLRGRLAKPITNQQILAGLEVAQRCGIESVKMYFLLGIPEETDDDVRDVARLVRTTRDLLVRGRAGRVTAAVNLLVPKPYTPFHRQPMLGRGEWRRRLALVERELSRVSHVTLQHSSWREALWQGYLARADAAGCEHLERAAAGTSLGRLLTDHRAEIEGLATTRRSGEPWWHFIATAPQQP